MNYLVAESGIGQHQRIDLVTLDVILVHRIGAESQGGGPDGFLHGVEGFVVGPVLVQRPALGRGQETAVDGEVVAVDEIGRVRLRRDGIQHVVETVVIFFSRVPELPRDLAAIVDRRVTVVQSFFFAGRVAEDTTCTDTAHTAITRSISIHKRDQWIIHTQLQ